MKRSRTIMALSLISTGVTLTPEPLDAREVQDTVSLGTAPICRTCKLRLDAVLRLGTSEPGEGSVGYPRSVAATSKGFFVSPQGAVDRVETFDPTGRYLGPLISGRQAFRAIGALAVDAADSLFIFDHGAKQVKPSSGKQRVD